MLSKEICKQCINKHRKSYYQLGMLIPDGEPAPWDDLFDEYFWTKENHVKCSQEAFCFTKVDGNPPDKCFYLLEHLMCQDG